jgi:hypothetical protein
LASTGKVEAKYTASDSFVKVQFLLATHLFYVENRLSYPDGLRQENLLKPYKYNNRQEKELEIKPTSLVSFVGEQHL